MAGISYIRNSTAAAQRKRRKPRAATAKPSLGYIRDVTRRQQDDVPKPPVAAIGIDYIRKNTKREVDARQKAANAAARAAKPAAATPQAGAPGVSGSGAPVSYVDTVAPNPSKAAKTVKKKAKKTPKEPAAPAAPVEENPIDALYNAAGRQLDKQERAAQMQLEARLADQKAFDEYVARVRSAANTTLGEQFAASASNAAAARQQSLATVQGYANEAIAAAGGNQQVLDDAGVTANLTGNAYTMGATAQDSAAAQANQQSLMEYQVGQQNMDLARSANMRSESEADRRATMAEIAQRRFDLSQEQAKAKIEQSNADRQFALDSIVADYLNKQRASEVEIARYNAETERMGTKTPEERAAQLAIDKSRAEAQNKRDLSTAEKNAAANRQAYAKAINKWFRDTMNAQGIATVDDIHDADSRIEFGRSAVQQLYSIDKNISVEDAYRMLRGILPPHVINDNRIKQEIARSFQ